MQSVKEVEERPEESETEEARRIRIQRRKARAPTLREQEEHNRTHLPYRSWCPTCVAGRGVQDGHRQKDEDEERTMPTVAYDYCFMRNEQDGEYVPVLVGREKFSKLIFSHVVPA